MIRHTELGTSKFRQLRMLKSMMDNGSLQYGGNRKLGIYGTFSCKSGKCMKVENRVFFASEKEAIENGYRPCGHCLKDKYMKWKDLLNR